MALPAGESQTVEVGVQAKPFQFIRVVATGSKKSSETPSRGARSAPRAAQPQNAQSIATVCSVPPATR
jgi:hypothetical protein